MPLGIGNYVFSNELIKEAINIWEVTRDKGKEFGTKLCTRSETPPWQLNSGSRCKGNICNINLEKSDCPGKEYTDMGDLHGHPYSGADFSPADLMGAAFRGDPIICVVGNWKMRCATRKNDGGTPERLRKEYGHLLNEYMKVIQPYYDNWGKTGACTAMSDEDKALYDGIKEKIQSFFDIHDYEFSDLVDAGDLNWSEMQRKYQEQEV